MRGRKSIGIELVCLTVWAVMAMAQTARPPDQPSANLHTAQSGHELGPKTEFLGWRGEVALFREQTDTETGPGNVAYYAMRPGSNLTTAVTAKTAWAIRHGSAKLAPGRVLLSDYNPASGDTAVAFHLDTDPAEVDALGSAIAKWSEEGQGKLHNFPVVHATLTVKLVRNGQEETAWQRQRELSATHGEGGYVYDPPRLRFAVISPAGSSLLFELATDAGSEFIRVSLKK